MAGGFVYWAVAGLAVTFVGGLLRRLLPGAYAVRCGRFILSRAFRVFIVYLKSAGLLVLDDAGLQKLAGMPGPLIVAPNHIALWDAVFIIARMPELICLMKGAILRNPFLGGGARLAGYIPNDSAAQMLIAACRKLKKGEKILYFPEGTRTRREALWISPFHKGAALLAKHSSAPIVPVYIRSSSRIFEKRRSLFYRPRFPIHISFEVGAPVRFEENDGVKEFTRELERSYAAELAKPHPLRRTEN